MKLTYISNINIKEFSGGMSGINNAVYHQLERFFDIPRYNLINPKEDLVSKVFSKLLKVFGLKRNYHFFSNKRLDEIGSQVNNIQIEGDAMFFMGFTQWIKTNPKVPYYCYNDACFATYVEYYNNKSEFSSSDLNRIFDLEKNWLKNAKKVFFNSQWALEETKRLYQMEGKNFINAGVGGFIKIPEADKYSGGFNFIFISREFIPKGGMIVIEAFKKVKEVEPLAKLWIVGEKPPKEVELGNGIEYKGFFNKMIPNDKVELEQIFEQSFALVHPTLKDTTTLVISELAYYGCPAISSNRFAIPEFVVPGETGYLLEDPQDKNEVAKYMLQLIKHKQYHELRKSTRNRILNYHTWEKVGERLNNGIIR